MHNYGGRSDAQVPVRTGFSISNKIVMESDKKTQNTTAADVSVSYDGLGNVSKGNISLLKFPSMREDSIKTANVTMQKETSRVPKVFVSSLTFPPMAKSGSKSELKSQAIKGNIRHDGNEKLIFE